MGPLEGDRVEVDTVTLGELRRTVDALGRQLGDARAELGALVAIPVQLDNMAALWNAQLAAARQEHKADMAAVREALAHQASNATRDLAAHAAACAADASDIREDVKDLQAWQTWALRLVIGFVVLGVLGLVVTNPTP